MSHRLALAAASMNLSENASQPQMDENGTTEDSSHSALNASVDLKRFILAPEHKKKQILRAGDWVQFEHAILRCTMRTRVLRVEAAARFPLSLENGEVCAVQYSCISNA